MVSLLEKNPGIRKGKEFPEPLQIHSAGIFASWELDI